MNRSNGPRHSIALALLWWALSALPAHGAGRSTDRAVLPTDVSPERYRLEIVPDAQALSFKGLVEIDVTVRATTRQVVLNSADLVIDRASLDTAAEAAEVAYDEPAERVTLSFVKPVMRGAHTLRIAYHGRIYRQASGLFCLDYDTPLGRQRALFTKFENSDARRFVPSWDEPDRKAMFELSAVVPSNQLALSNMPVAASEELPGSLKRVRFAITPRMSTYLLFFGTGDLERVHRDVEGVDLGVVVKRGDAANAAFALDAAARMLAWYNQYFDLRYALPKLDLVAGPGSSQRFSAMENWGAIFYFERSLLVDPRISTELDRQHVSLVIAHEMAHQWFGDLVTMQWWDDLWLNEGFASWMEYKVTDHFHPQWNVWLQALASTRSAMAIDARDGTHPVITPLSDVMQANGAFDSITYLKGAAVIRMLESYVGEEAFRAGVRRYLRRYAYQNTVTDDLWREMDRGARRPITRIAHDFTLQAGVPLIREISARCHGNSTVLGLVQERFDIDANSTTATHWHVPVRAAAPGSAVATQDVVVAPKSGRFVIDGCGAALLNAGQSGYFRSEYSAEGLAAIERRFPQLPVDDQFGLLDDTLSLAYAGKVPMAAWLELISALPPYEAGPQGLEPEVLSELIAQLQGMDRLYRGLSGRERFRALARGLLEPAFRRLGWDAQSGESDSQAILRSVLIEALGDFGDAGIVAEAARRFERFVAEPASLDAATRRSVLRTVAVHADRTTWDRLRALAKSAGSALERQQFYDLLAAPQDDSLVREALELALEGEPPTTLVPEIVRAGSRLHPELAVRFATAHWDRLAGLIEPNTRSRYVPRLAEGASDAALIDTLEDFARTQIPTRARRDLERTEAGIRYFARIRAQRLPQVDRWLTAEAEPR